MGHPPDKRAQPLAAVAGQRQHDIAALGAGVDAGPVDRGRFLYGFDALKTRCNPPEGVVAWGVTTSCGSHPSRSLKSLNPCLPCFSSRSTTTTPAGTAQPKSQCGHFRRQTLITSGSDDASLNPCAVSGVPRALTGKMPSRRRRNAGPGETVLPLILSASHGLPAVDGAQPLTALSSSFQLRQCVASICVQRRALSEAEIVFRKVFGAVAVGVRRSVADMGEIVVRIGGVLCCCV